MKLNPFLFILTAAASLVLSQSASAIERRFAFTYEATTSPKGSVELENWVTWKHRNNKSGPDSDLFQFRHELEIGVTDRLQFSIYGYNWQYDRHDEEGHKARWENSGFEVIYNLSNPTTDFLGSAVYLEALIGEDEFELEGKLLLQKNFGPLTVAYNAILEATWEGEHYNDERNGEFAQSLGVSYDLNKAFSVGAEVLHEIELPDWSDHNDSVVWAGPNASVRFGRMFVTGTALFQVTDVEEEPDFQVRLVTGFDF